jgi:hypothetical protein
MHHWRFHGVILFFAAIDAKEPLYATPSQVMYIIRGCRHHLHELEQSGVVLLEVRQVDLEPRLALAVPLQQLAPVQEQAVRMEIPDELPEWAQGAIQASARVYLTIT